MLGMNKQSRGVSKLPHDVYRVFAAGGELLYVGCSVNVFNRLREHKAYAGWWHLAHTGTVHRYPNRAHALSIEAEAIRSESPTANKVLEKYRISSAFSPDDIVEEPMTLFWEDGEVWVDGEG